MLNGWHKDITLNTVGRKISIPLERNSTFFLLKAYFCGQHVYCMRHDSKQAVAEAKRNIEKYYNLVGLMERLEDTWKLLEKEYPDVYFKGFYAFAAANQSNI